MTYQLASVEVPIKPTLEGMQGEIQRDFKGVGDSLGNALRAGAQRGLSSVSGILGRSLANVGTNVGRTIGSTISNSIKVTATASLAAAGAVAGQAFSGGLKREIQVGDSQARLLAMGKDAKEVSNIMASVTKSVTGTQYGLGEAAKVASQLLNSGSKSGSDLEKQLERTTKLADISGASFEEMGSIYSKIMSGNLVFTEDVNQLADRGIAIYDALGKQMGMSFTEVRKAISDGKVDFDTFSKAIDTIQWDSATYSLNSITASFKNLRAQLSIMGGKFLSPIVSELPKVFVNLGKGLKNLQSTKGFQNFVARVQGGTSQMMQGVENLSKKFESAMQGSGVTKFFDFITESWRNLGKLLSGKELIGAGVGAGFIGTLLQQIPLIGGAFSSLNPIVGGFIGLIAQLFKSSEKLRDAFSQLLRGSGEFAKSMGESLGGIGKGLSFTSLESIGNSLASVISKIDLKKLGADFGSNIKAFVDTFAKYLPSIKDGLGELFDSVSQALGKASGMEGKSIGEILGSILGKGLDTTLEALSVVLPVAIDVVKLLGTVVTSDVAKGVLGALGSAASWLADHQAVLFTGIGVLGALFVAGKFGLPFWLALRTNAPVVGTAIGSLGATLGAAGGSLIGGLATMGSAAIAGAAPIAALAGLVLGFGGVLTLLNNMGAFDALGNLADVLTDFAFNVIGKVVETLTNTVNSMIDIAGRVGEMVTQVSGQIAGDFSLFATTLGILITNLATNGATAGANATILAGGLVALSGAIVALSGSSIANGAAKGLGGLLGGSNDASGTFTGLINEITNLNNTFANSEIVAMQSGSNAGNNFANSMAIAIRNKIPSLEREISNMLNRLQKNLNANALQVRMSGAGAGGNTYNTNNTRNSSTIRIGRVNSIDDILRRG